MKNILPVIAITLSSLTLAFSAFVLVVSIGCIASPLGMILALPLWIAALIAGGVCLILTLPFVSNRLMRIAFYITLAAAALMIASAVILFAIVGKAA